jgi:5S rRNA maturation endonuclease (ribonuclease M5)
MHGSRPKSEDNKVNTLLRRLQEKEEKVTEALNLLAEESAKGTTILVEGKKDVETLRALNVRGTIITVKTGGKSYLDIVSELEKRKLAKVILLLDFDRRGKQGTNRLRHNLERTGIKVELEVWLTLLGSVGKDVQCIEGLATYLESLKARIDIIS